MKLNERIELTQAPALADLLWVRDISDTTDSAGGTDKKITYENLVSSVGGLSEFTEVLHDTALNDTWEVAQLSALNAGTTGDVDVALTPKGSGALLAHVPDGTAAGGNKRGDWAIDFSLNRSSATQVASGFFSTILGGKQHTASGNYSVVTGGAVNSATGYYAFIGAGHKHIASGEGSVVVGGGSITSSDSNKNTASAKGSAVVCGLGNTASGFASFVGSGYANLASATYSAIVGGNNNTASGENSFVGGGDSNVASQDYSVISGGQNNSINEFGSACGVLSGSDNAISGPSPYGSVILGGRSNSVSGGVNDAVVGGLFNSVSGGSSAALSGRSNGASTRYSVVCGGKSNTCVGGDYEHRAYHAICGGELNEVGIAGTNRKWAFVGGGFTNKASGEKSAVSGGEYNEATGQGSAVGGGGNNTAGGLYSVVAGGKDGSAVIAGQQAHAMGKFTNDGDAQRSDIVANVSTADATATELQVDGAAGAIVIPNNTTWEAQIRIVAREQGGARVATFWRRALITKDGTAASATLIADSTPDPDLVTATTPWSVALSADTTNGALKIDVTGEAATNIRWVAYISLVEVGYA